MARIKKSRVEAMGFEIQNHSLTFYVKCSDYQADCTEFDNRCLGDKKELLEEIELDLALEFALFPESENLNDRSGAGVIFPLYNISFNFPFNDIFESALKNEF